MEKTRYKFIHFERIVKAIAPLADIDIEEVQKCKFDLECLNNKSNCVLGDVSYYKSWRQWVFDPFEDCVWNTTCLADLIHFLNQLNGQKTTGKGGG